MENNISIDDSDLWDKSLTPIIHDDGKGLTICLHLDNEDEGTTFSIHLETTWPEVGFPSFDMKQLQEIAANSLIEFIQALDDE